MSGKVTLATISVLLLCLLAAFGFSKTADDLGASVHEWGTFTSVAGENGEAVEWRTYGGPSDLPCFVDRFDGFKSGLYGSVRMETPVLYFYSSRSATADVKVRFPNGTITEWFPKATLSKSYDAIQWKGIQVSPDAAADFAGSGQSHYYAARETDATPLQVGSQKERFLFYRGVGDFPLPISAKVLDDGTIEVRSRGDRAIAGLVLFENRKGLRRRQLVDGFQNQITLDPKSLQTDDAGLFRDLERTLIEQGLYPLEAKAMIQTWRDSWFEEGTRLFYIVPKADIDSVLPLEIQPSPKDIARVFVGRMEIITPAIQEEVKQAVATNDSRALEKYGRFLEPIARRIGVGGPWLKSVAERLVASTRGCSQ